MNTQLIATIMTAVMHYYFGISLLITLPQSTSQMLCLTTIIILASIGLFLSRIKLCPSNETKYYVLSFVEILMFLALLEAAVGLAVSINFKLNEFIENAYPTLAYKNTMSNLTDIIMLALAVGVFFTAMLDSNVIHKTMEYYTSFINRFKFFKCAKDCYGSKSTPEANETTSTKYYNPECPCHGDANVQKISRMGTKC